MKWWCAINTCLIIFLIYFVGISLSIPKYIEDKVIKMELEWDTYKSCNKDTIIVNIENNVEMPKIIKLTK